MQRRVRIYPLSAASSPEERAARVRQARREFAVLEGIEHPGILRCKDYKDTELSQDDARRSGARRRTRCIFAGVSHLSDFQRPGAG